MKVGEKDFLLPKSTKRSILRQFHAVHFLYFDSNSKVLVFSSLDIKFPDMGPAIKKIKVA